MSHTKLNDYVVIDYSNGVKSVKKLTPNTQIKLYNKKIHSNLLIKIPFNTSLQLSDNGTLQEVNPKKITQCLTNPTSENPNRDVIKSEIYKEEKYNLKKQLKAKKFFTIRKANASILIDSLDQKSHMFLRGDSLARILILANLHCASEVLLVDKMEGFLTGAVSERTEGKIISILAMDDEETMEKNVAVTEEIGKEGVVNYGVVKKEDDVGMIDGTDPDGGGKKQMCDDEGVTDTKDGTDPNKGGTKQICDDKEEDINPRDNRKSINNSQKKRKRKSTKNFLAFNTPQRENVFFVKTKKDLIAQKLVDFSFDSFILAAGKNFELTQTVKNLWHLLRPNGYFVVYSQYLETLTECASYLNKHGLCVNVRLNSTLLFEHKVETNRTRPINRTLGSAGFILSGIKVI